jgi:replication initiation and membrane attachment protein
MRISNLHHFTEQHRFFVYREFALNPLDNKMLTQAYQPMVGGGALSLYMTLYSQIPSDRIGYSKPEQHRKLFRSLGIEPAEPGRRALIEEISRLEAVGLAQSMRNYFPATDDYIYEYRLFSPLSVQEFFKTEHLCLLLRDKIGNFPVLFLRDEFMSDEPEELSVSDYNEEDLSASFYDIFSLGSSAIDREFEQALSEASAARAPERPVLNVRDWSYGDIAHHFPRTSKNRPFVEGLKQRQDLLRTINFEARKFRLDLQHTCRLLNEEGMFDEEGELYLERFQYEASQYFAQEQLRRQKREITLHRMEQNSASSDETSDSVKAAKAESAVEMEFFLEVPARLRLSMNMSEYNRMLRNEPCTSVLERFFSEGEVPYSINDLIVHLHVNYKMKDPVINVLIHYLHVSKESSWAQKYVDKIAADMLTKGVTTYEQAVDYVRNALRRRSEAGESAKGRSAGAAATAGGARRGSGTGAGGRSAGVSGGRSGKPKIVVADIPEKQLSEEEIQALRRKVLGSTGKNAVGKVKGDGDHVDGIHS